MVKKGYKPIKLKEIFIEVVLNIEKKGNKFYEFNKDLRLNTIPTTELLKDEERKKFVIDQKIVLYLTYYLKNIFRNRMQEIYAEICRNIFKDLLNMSRIIVTYYKLDSLRSLVILSS